MARPKRTPNKQQPVYYTVKEAAALLRITEGTLFRLIKSRKIDSRLLGGRRLIPREAIEMPEER
jgi:excisionase family DNA binding protein